MGSRKWEVNAHKGRQTKKNEENKKGRKIEGAPNERKKKQIGGKNMATKWDMKKWGRGKIPLGLPLNRPIQIIKKHADKSLWRAHLIFFPSIDLSIYFSTSSIFLWKREIYKGNKDKICQKHAPNRSSDGHISKFPSKIFSVKKKKSKENIKTKIVKNMPQIASSEGHILKFS